MPGSAKATAGRRRTEPDYPDTIAQASTVDRVPQMPTLLGMDSSLGSTAGPAPSQRCPRLRVRSSASAPGGDGSVAPPRASGYPVASDEAAEVSREPSTDFPTAMAFLEAYDAVINVSSPMLDAFESTVGQPGRRIRRLARMAACWRRARHRRMARSRSPRREDARSATGGAGPVHLLPEEGRTGTRRRRDARRHRPTRARRCHLDIFDEISAGRARNCALLPTCCSRC